MEHNIPVEPRSAIDLPGLMLMMRRHVQLLAGGAALGVVLAALLLLIMRPQYTATATLILDSREEKVMSTDAVLSPFRPTANAIASEAAVITAPAVLKRVVDRLELAKDPEFEVIAPTGMVRAVRAGLFSMLGGRKAEAAPADGPSEETIEIIDKLRKSMEVTFSQYTNLIQVAVTSKDPRKAARIANAVADAYLDQQLEGRYGATRRATDWLQARLVEHKDMLRQSEQRFEGFKAQMEMVEKEGLTLEEKQLVRLNEELILARAKTAEARAKYMGVRQQVDGGAIDDKSLAEIVRSDLITLLRAQLAQVIREMDSVTARFGPGHPAVVKARAEKRGISDQIDNEVRRIVAILKNEYEVAHSRETSLEQSLRSAADKNSSQRGEFVRLRELQREAESDKVLYEAMLQRVKQTAAQETWKSADFRVVAEAVPPLTPSQPRTKLLALAGLSLGLGLGIGLTLLSELLDTTFKRGRDVEAKLAVPHLVDVPQMSPRLLGGSAQRAARNAFQFAAEHTGSPFADAMLGLHSALQPAHGEAPIKTVMFTSATPGEGKSVIAANYAQLAARSGLRVLLICTDLRTPTVNWFAPAQRLGNDLVDYLEGRVAIEATVASSDRSPIDLIPAARTSPNAATLLASPRMHKLLEWAKANYDLVVIDTVAIVTCLDGRMLARHVDATVLVIEWLKTRHDTAKEAVELLIKNDARIAGAVLSKVDFTKARLYGLNASA